MHTPPLRRQLGHGLPRGLGCGFRRCLVIAAVVVAIGGCASGSPSSSTRDTTSPVDSLPAHTGSPTTAAATSVAPTALPVVTVPPDTRFDPPCVERAVADGAISRDGPDLDVFGPLGAEPVVQLTLPRLTTGEISDWTRPLVSRIPGGMLVDIRPYFGTPDRVGILVAVNVDGSVRWQRCLDPSPDMVVVPGGGEGDEFVVSWSTYGSAGLVDQRFEVWSLVDGRISRSWDELLAANDITGDAVGYRDIRFVESGSVVVLGPVGGGRPVEASDALLVVDLSDLSMSVVPYPPGELGRPIDAVQLDLTDDGRLIHLDQGGAVPGGTVAAVESGDGWSSAAGDLDAAVPVRAEYSYGSQRQALVAVDSQGVELWRRDDVLSIPAEGFHVAVDGDVVLAAACSDVPNIDGDWCPGRKLLAVDATTGRTLWERKGAWAVSVLGDGRALIAGPFEVEVATPAPAPTRWTMIELSSGNSVGDQTWTDPWSFGIGCCDEPQGASRSGGVVFTVDDDTVEMWYPTTRSTPLQRVSLG